MDELLGMMLKELEGIKKAKDEDREKKKACDERKEQVGIDLMERSVKR